MATPGDDGLHSLRFELRNPGDVPIALPAHQPFIAFEVLASADGKTITVHQPALDIPVNPAIIRLPPREAVTIHSPIRLRIGERAEPGTDGLVWTIAHPWKGLVLRIGLDLPPPFAGPCPLSFG